MKEIFVQYAQYNVWANSRLLDVISALPVEKQMQTVNSSFPSLYATLLHMWQAESVWWQRLKMIEPIVYPQQTFTGSMVEMVQHLTSQNEQWKQWVQSVKEHTLHHEFIYKNTKRESFKQPVHQMLLHVFNHGTYHRGQLVTMLRQLGETKIPDTDFIVWSRKRS